MEICKLSSHNIINIFHKSTRTSHSWSGSDWDAQRTILDSDWTINQVKSIYHECKETLNPNAIIEIEYGGKYTVHHIRYAHNFVVFSSRHIISSQLVIS